MHAESLDLAVGLYGGTSRWLMRFGHRFLRRVALDTSPTCIKLGDAFGMEKDVANSMEVIVTAYGVGRINVLK